jgi:predicted DNA-binding transcriptional regulator AlpA
MMTGLETLPPEITRLRVLDTAQACAFVGISVPQWRRMYREGDAPSPIHLNKRKLGWQIGTLADWLEGRKTAATRAA